MTNQKLSNPGFGSFAAVVIAIWVAMNSSLWAEDNKIAIDAEPLEAFTEPYKTIRVAASDFGTVREIHVELGQRVRKSDLIATLEMNVLQASRKAAQSRADSKAKLSAAQIEFEQKNKRYEKVTMLFKEGAGSPTEVEKAYGDAEIARQNVEAIREDMRQNQLALEEIEARIENRKVRSPIDGVVVKLDRKPGEYVSSSVPEIATVVELTSLKVVFYLPTENTTHLKAGNSLPIYLPDTGQSASSVVEYVAPITEFDSGRVQVNVVIENSKLEIRSGMRCLLQEKASIQSQAPQLRKSFK